MVENDFEKQYGKDLYEKLDLSCFREHVPGIVAFVSDECFDNLEAQYKRDNRPIVEYDTMKEKGIPSILVDMSLLNYPEEYHHFNIYLCKKSQSDKMGDMTFEAKNYWISSATGLNAPEEYLNPKHLPRSRYLHSLIDGLVDKNATILEIGCNAGRNLAYIHEMGYTNLVGVELNKKACDLFKLRFGNIATVLNEDITHIIDKLPIFDCIISVAVFEHLHDAEDWIFEKIAAHARKHIILIADEKSKSGVHFPRNYKTLFEPFGFKEIKTELAGEYNDFQPEFTTRILRRM